ncbi:hypothetical protein LZZ90_07095 [Flavobacterium sp. SM15]|uniref:hypothetical protein n=1 Tax=Flavobacterium sp. SM15 TaxID=2908005 RepID=UPI001EDB9AD3|nr:hypothetical protein [Flavobacterium sp. SM15]MCG2611268.1 hypothetical protein [Flavobacterium sp. SM15]
MKNLVICAYSVYPEDRTSEGIVNKNWVDIINVDNVAPSVVLSSNKVVSVTQKSSGDYQVTNKPDFLLEKAKSALKSKKGVPGLLFRVLNWIFLRLSIFPKESNLFNFIWISKQSKGLKQLSETDTEYVYWARILPTITLAPFLKIQKNIPLVINVNDPVENLDYCRNIFAHTKNSAQCWTFPSKRLSQKIAQQYDLDPARCFVVPHAMRKQQNIFMMKKSAGEKLRFLYTGTFYKSAFTNSFMDQLKNFGSDAFANQVEFVFVLSQYDDQSIEWLKEAIPNVVLFFNLTREEVFEEINQAHCMLVVDSQGHTDLLKGKLMEAISFGLPVFSISYQDSVMDKVVSEYGSFSAYQEIENDIFEKLKLAFVNLSDLNWCEQFYKQREIVMEKASEESIRKMTFQISEYAHQRFLHLQGKRDAMPQVLTHLNWP